MTTRLLPRDEWDRLAGTEADSVWRTLPDHAQVIVVEDEAAIVGCWIVLPVLHAECLWIAPAHRKGTSVGRRLLTALRRVVPGNAVWTSAMSDDVRGLLAKVGATPVPGDHYLMPMGRG